MVEPLRLKLTYEDFLGFPEDGKRHELIDGDHFVTPAPFTAHQSISAALTQYLRAHIVEAELGKLYAAPTDVVLSEHDVVEPDLLFISNERMDRVTEANIQGAPDLLVEILSPGTRRRDEITKRHLYEGYGVREYWIVDPELETVKVFRAGERGFESPVELALERDEVLTSPLLPGLELPLERVFE